MDYLKEQLYRLVGDREDYFTLKVCDSLGNTKECNDEAERMRHFILAMPDMVEQIKVWGKEKIVLVYLGRRKKIISHDYFGLFAHLPDAFYIAQIYQVIKNKMDPSLLWVQFDTKDISNQIPSWLILARKIIPFEAEKLGKLLARVIRKDNGITLPLLTQVESMVNEGGPVCDFK